MIILTSKHGIAPAMIEAGQEEMCSSEFAATVKQAGFTHWELVDPNPGHGPGCNAPSPPPDLSHHKEG
jgi:hypothetical protein